jgi:glycosyltransferase involved in cell wall biosynthesis
MTDSLAEDTSAPPTVIATIMAVYRSDDPLRFDLALQSTIDQKLDMQVRHHIHLAVDGPVPPGIEQVIQKHASHLHRVIRLKENKGLAAALNQLIERLEDEELVFRMDADDVSHPTRYSRQIAYLNAHPDIDILGTDIYEIDIRSQHKRIVSYCKDPARTRHWICHSVPVAHPTVCFRRKVFQSVGLYPDSGHNQDIAMWFKCLAAGHQFANIHVPLLDFSINEGFWQRRSFEKAWGEFMCYVKGILSLHGLTWRLMYPAARLLIRLLPRQVSQIAYRIRSQPAAAD